MRNASMTKRKYFEIEKNNSEQKRYQIYQKSKEEQKKSESNIVNQKEARFIAKKSKSKWKEDWWRLFRPKGKNRDLEDEKKWKSEAKIK